MFLIIAWSTLILVIAVFTILVAKTFVMVPESATSSILFIFLAVLFGLGVYRMNYPLGIITIVGVAILFGCVGLGLLFPLKLKLMIWIIILMVYVFIASVTPVWLLLQPRDYLNSFLLYTLIFAAILGIVFTNPTIHLSAFTTFQTSQGALFPLLFVTVACGAVSGFHSLVASGTTAKQLDKETDAWFIGYGGMLIEGMLAVIALIVAASLTSERFREYLGSSGGGPIALFSECIGS
ncbi:MAG: carbon starvation protein A, partial [bacterium (Candidatus Stahlbacteria) CG23_combo_of_CG06-09_8_20_14_all_34_7]